MALGFLSSSKKICDSGILKGYTDYHSHLLPSVDDGVQDIAETLELLRVMHEQGVAEVWLTPHIMEEIPNLPSDLRARLDELNHAIDQDSCPQLHLAAENMLDAGFSLDRASQLVMPDNHILVETSYFTPPYNMKGVLRDILSAGYYPLLAHPCRYEYMDEEDYEELRAMNVHFQLNLPVLTGMYGPGAEKKARWLLEHGYYHRTGTDTHSLKNYQCFIRSKVSRKDLSRLQQIV